MRRPLSVLNITQPPKWISKPQIHPGGARGGGILFPRRENTKVLMYRSQKLSRTICTFKAPTIVTVNPDREFFGLAIGLIITETEEQERMAPPVSAAAFQL